MSPTMKKDDRVIVNKIKVTFDLLKDGDVIMYGRDNKIHFSRIVGKPGESIEIKIITYIEMIDASINNMVKIDK